MSFSLVALPVRRPTATSMFFLALVMLGLFAWYRIPIELMPALSGEQLVVTFARPGSEPEVVEREILLPLEARVGELPGLKETWGEVNGANGRLTLEFERGVNIRVRELELSSIAAELARTQPEGTFINVSSQDLTAFSRFAMIIHVTGGADQNALRDLVDARIQPRVAAVPGVSQVLATGGAPREVTVWIDPDRCAALGIRPDMITRLLGQSVQRLRHLGGTERDGLRWQVVLDGRPAGIASLGELRIDPARPVLLRHVADIEMTTARAESAFRINGADATGLIVFQEEGENLVRLGRALRERVDELRAEWAPYGVDFRIGFDAAETVEEQLDRLKQLAVWGFAIALVVLFLFLRELRAVAVVALAVPVSLLIAGAMLYLGGYTLNLVTLLGLAVGIGMLVDNSVVVFEAVQRFLERGLLPESAAVAGIRRTVRAILAASATNAVVFLPAVFLVEDSFIRGALELVAVAILLPLFASLVVAVGLVPLLAKRFAAPAAVARLARNAEWRRAHGGRPPPQPARALLSAILKSALRRPSPWLVAVTVSIVLTIVIALPWVLVGSLAQQAEQASEVSLEIELAGGSSLDAAGAVFDRIEQAVLGLGGIELVESSFQEVGGTLTVHLDRDARDAGAASARRVREEVRRAVEGLDDVEVRTANLDGSGNGGSAGGGGGGAGGALGASASEVRVSGPDMTQISLIAREIQSRLESIPDVEEAWISGGTGQDELRVEPLPTALAAYRLNPEDVLSALNVFRREGVQLQVGFTLADGRELPLTVRRPELVAFDALAAIEGLRLATDEGAMPLGAVTTGSRVPAPPAIAHHNGRRELSVSYSLGSTAPESGPERVRLESAIQDAVRTVYRPAGYTVESVTDESTDWFKLIFVPVLLLLYAVLAITFESFTLPILVLVAVPLTVLGGTWALVFAGVGAGIYALVGVIALLGLTVNPAILLVDRMQQRVIASGSSGGAAAIAAVRERTRPVLMTSCTTIAGLWPLALSTGEEFEIWPPFATVVIGGLATSTLLTLLVIPVGFVMLTRIDRIFGRLGPWIVLGWLAATAAVIAPLIVTNQLNTLTWQIITTVLVAAAFLWLALAIFRKGPRLAFDPGATAIEARYLAKVYGRPGPIKRAWRIGRDGTAPSARRSRRDSGERASTYGLLLAGAVYLTVNLDTMVWRLLFAYLAAAFGARAVIELKNAIWPSPAARNRPGRGAGSRFDSIVLSLAPWIMLAALFVACTLLPGLDGARQTLPPVAVVVLAVLTAIVQLGRRTARRAAEASRAATVAAEASARASDAEASDGGLDAEASNVGVPAEASNVGVPAEAPGVTAEAPGVTGEASGAAEASGAPAEAHAADAAPEAGRVRTAWRQACLAVLGFDLPRAEIEALATTSFAAKQGMIGILGPNGAGKTTLLRLLAGVLDPTAGAIHYSGMPKRRVGGYVSRWVGYLPQEFGLPNHLTAREYLDYFALLYDVGDRRERRARVDALLAEVGLDERKHEKIGGYSGGMRQRVAVARTLLRHPPIIIVDEPTVGLDPRERIRFRNLLSRLAEGRVVLFSTHVVEDVAVSCQRVIVMGRGRIVYDGKPAELAKVAEGKTWEIRSGRGDSIDLPKTCKVVDQVPEAGGGARIRVLCDFAPHPGARAIEPVIEDGYLELVTRGGERDA